MSAMTQMMEMMALGAAGTPYNTAMAATLPDLWWQLDDYGASPGVGDSSASHAYSTVLSSWASYGTNAAGVSINAPSGFSGLGRGFDFNFISAGGTKVGNITGNTIPTNFMGGAGSASSWAIGLWVAGSATANQYLLSRVNNAAIIYQFVTDQVEFFALGYSGTNPRTGSQISLPASDTTTPHWIVYRYNAGQWSGFKDGVKVFDVARTFGLVSSTRFYANTDGSSSGTTRQFDIHGWLRAPSDAEIASIWAARNNP